LTNSEFKRGRLISDPARKPRVWAVFGLLFLALLPIWPLHGNWGGLPAWAVFTVGVSFLVSLFTTWVIFRVWRDPGEAPASSGEGNDDG